MKHAARDEFERWRRCCRRLEKQSARLEEEWRAYLAGTRDIPEDLLTSVRELQEESVALFEQVRKALGGD